ncbi:Uncharacterised protein [Serratia proteamaculans]|uniref:hypothetical protein n=1 Tax=Serratia proteamaculans TaxID=28151 RepID=UPI001249E1F7|nr:hypothetical protein [Serratia proteamaculans]KAB1498448.1 hypothetical protein F8R23_03040 [Serratia proteamaculans]CAI0755537.1 Uncharacterised protein [Serratia proteamaculans]CAI0814142.1 Uncharacterised protein [Serratia proteamaculans]
MKKLLAALALATSLLSGCSTTHPWMDNAKVGVVDGEQVVVLFPAGDGFYYRPQFSSDCRRTYNKYYQLDNNSTGCRIAAERVSNIRAYRETGNTTVVRTDSPMQIQIHSNSIENL